MNYMVDTLYFGRFVISVGITWVYSRVDICGLEGGWGFFFGNYYMGDVILCFLNYRYVMIKEETSKSKYRHKIIIIMVKKK